MKFTRTKKLVFFNNKGGVGKTTLAYNTAVKLSEFGYKTVLIDLDPQCNLSKLSLGKSFEENLFSVNQKTIFTVLEGIIKGGADIDKTVDFESISKNLFILPGSLLLSEYENSLISAYGDAAQGVERGFFITSAIDRFLSEKGLENEVDIYIIDTSPNLNLLNRIIFLGSDYFITPLMPDAFSVQGIENLGTTFEKWKDNWKKTAKVLARDKQISHDKVLDGEGLFIGYIINSYNQYSKKPIKSNEEWIKKVPSFIKKYLSEKHCRNGLVEKSWKNKLALIKDFGQLPPLAQIKNKAIFNLDPIKDNFDNVKGTKENLEQAKKEFQQLTENILEILNKY
ncbi:MAG: AAA family ATPase [Candidatus Shapirobacteria bacterium]|jgi:cellulose biosynthesis protein BcsQ|nr:AAA family ATPase [Candidatus Shapirobacteria bacterium]MDD3002958.1 AAA family ATPase [Candidatus Shapirobacteria bacterium]MDD4383241.1 AAA family ATPase [Candidatus Shapirobacteria bacterium]